MSQEVCQKCGHQVAGDVQACPRCGHALKNGAIPEGGSRKGIYLTPEEWKELNDGKTPKKILDLAWENDTEEAYSTALREFEATGGRGIDDVIQEINQMVKDRE